MAKRLRSGYTTGACAAAAAKAASQMLSIGQGSDTVEIPFPDGTRHGFAVHASDLHAGVASASIIKDAGDDPDVTNGAEICARVRLQTADSLPECHVVVDNIILVAGEGVGRVTKPGLAVDVGEPAINPVPRQMITQAVQEIMATAPLLVEISVVNGQELAGKTLNRRLGIMDGLSILGTTGVVRPISADAWTATISASMSVAGKAGLEDIVLSTGRTSERGAQSRLDLQEEAFAMMGDYLEFSLLEARKQGFKRVHLSGMWAKITKAALRVPQTHVRNGALEMDDAAALLGGLGASGTLLDQISGSNTAREMYGHLLAAKRLDIVNAVCLKARQYAEDISGLEVMVYLVDSSAQVVEQV